MKLRVKYEITEAGRYLGHLDLTRTIMKTLRRAQIPVMLSEGFNPHPRLSFAMPLSVGHTGLAEYFEVILAQEISEEEFKESFNQHAPGAIRLTEVKEIKEKSESLFNMINAARYYLDFYKADCTLLKEACAGILEKKEIIILKKSKKKTKETDIRPLIFQIDLTEYDGFCRLDIALAHGSTANLRVQDLLDLLAREGIDIEDVSPARAGLFFREDQEYHDLMTINKSVGSL